MITVGVDVGAQKIKVVILKDDLIVAQLATKAPEGSTFGAERALSEALSESQIEKSDIDFIVSTGSGGGDVLFSNKYFSDVLCNAAGAIRFYPKAKTVISMGAEEFRAVRCSETGGVVDFVMNDKCAAGTGTFIEAMAIALEVPLEELGTLSLRSQKDISITSTCTILAESEVVSFIHLRQDKADIAKGILDSIASRVTSLVGRIGLEDDVILIGGVANNVGMVKALEASLSRSIHVPQSPETVGALGAALLAREGA